MRYFADGTPDSTFGTGGKVSTGLPLLVDLDTRIRHAAALTADGKIIFAGTTATDQAEVIRYNADGSIDSTFGSGGMIVIPQNVSPSAMAIDSSGRILISGTGLAALVRLDPNGTGYVFYGSPLRPSFQLFAPEDMAIQSNDDVLVAGLSNPDGLSSAAITRYLPHTPLSTNYLNQLYRDAFDRIIDPPSLQSFMQALDRGALTQAQVSTIIFGSSEYLADLTETLYQRYLHRNADAAALTAVVNALEHGARDEGIIAVLVGSDEYLAVRT
jgi:uncharacterized delta-60 repeat protein